MKSILLTISFLFITYLSSKAQIIAGHHDSNDLFVTLNHPITGSNSNTVSYSLDIDNDAITDFVFSVCYYQSPMLHYWDNKISSVGQWALADTNLICDTSGTVNFADYLGVQDTVNSFLHWGNSAYFYFESQGLPNPLVCYHSEFDNCGYIGIRKKMPNDTLYGWFYVKSGSTSFTVFSYAFNMGNTSIPESFLCNSFSIFPNPASDELNISGAFQGDYQLTICDITGNLIYTDSFSGNQIKVNTQKLNSGMYLLQVTDKKGMSSQKFIKN